MATYASLSELKAYLGVTDNSKDTLLTMYLESAEKTINNFLQVDTITSSTVKQRVELNDCLEFFMKKRPVTAVTKVNGITYTGVLGTDYLIEYQRKLTFWDLTDYTQTLIWETVEIEYTAGYTTCPADIKMAEMIIASGLDGGSAGNGKYSSYAIGDEKVVFKSQEEYDTTLKALSSYKLFK